MELSYETFKLLLELGDEEANRSQDCIWEREWAASRNCEGRMDFRYFARQGRVTSEGYRRY